MNVPASSSRRQPAKPAAVPASRSRPRSSGATKNASVRVRMYRQGLGDCFLLTFDPQGEPRHVLIDCGSLGATTTGVSLGETAKDIMATVGPGGVDLLIATHEHWDHVAGFSPRSKLFEQLKVKRVWLAWTENPADRDAQSLAKEKSDLGEALQLAAAALGAAPADERALAALEAVEGIAGFDGPLGADRVAPNLNAAMEAVRTGFGAPVTYREPGDTPLDHDWLKGFRIYVLGPPRSRKALTRLGKHGSPDIYGVAPGVRAAMARLTGESGVATDDEMPFAARCRHPPDTNTAKRWYPAYFAGDNAWRCIGGDWLHSTAETAEHLALQLDSLTNNTSLVLAIERVADGKVLLFPADAQEGNWLSWHDPKIRWQVPAKGGGTEEVTAEDLLKRTVFYKVGHHGSHNATASEKGLELMKGAGLTAFIPVDRRLALTRSPKGSWRMPARKLYRTLLEKCEGRVVRSDLGWAAPANKLPPDHPEKELEALATDAEWQAWQKAQAAASHVKVAPLYVEFLLG
jgi:hypothetical protein